MPGSATLEQRHKTHIIIKTWFTSFDTLQWSPKILGWNQASLDI